MIHATHQRIQYEALEHALNPTRSVPLQAQAQQTTTTRSREPRNLTFGAAKLQLVAAIWFRVYRFVMSARRRCIPGSWWQALVLEVRSHGVLPRKGGRVWGSRFRVSRCRRRGRRRIERRRRNAVRSRSGRISGIILAFLPTGFDVLLSVCRPSCW